jgi:hypothetical protein
VIKKNRLRMLLDAGMTVLLFICMSFQFVEQKNHEIFGTVLFVTFLLHHLLNARWYCRLGRGRYHPSRILITAVDFLLLANMIALMISGMRMSGYLFLWLPLEYSMGLAIRLHMSASFGGFLLIGLHVGLHVSMIRGMVCGTRKGKCQSVKQGDDAGALRVRAEQERRTGRDRAAGIRKGILTVVCLYGVTALVRRHFFEYIFGRYHFLMISGNESVFFYELDLAAIMILMVVLGYGLQTLLNRRKQT